MARLTIEKIKEKELFYKMPKWIYEYNLKPIDREVYMISYNNYNLSLLNDWVNEIGEIFFYNTQCNLEKILRADKRTIRKSFDKLISLGLLEEEKSVGRPTKFFLLDNSNSSSNKNVPSDKNVPSNKNDSSGRYKNVPTTSDIFVPRVRKSKKNELKRVVAGEKETATAPNETFLKTLKDLLIKNGFQNHNSQTLKNLENFSNSKISEIEKVIEFMKKKKKAINSKILVAILKDRDHKIVEPVEITKADKLTHMFKITLDSELADLRYLIAKDIGLPIDSNPVKTDLERILCNRYNNLNGGN